MVRVAVGYLAFAWLAIQLVSELGPILGMPTWFPRLVVGLLAVGFVIAVVLSWIYELTDQGIRTTSEVDRDASLRSVGGRRLDFVIIGLLLLALGYFVWESRFAPIADAVNVRSIAVLPFQDLSPDSNQEHLADGMAEELLGVLSRLSGFLSKGLARQESIKPPDEFSRKLRAGVQRYRRVLEDRPQRHPTRCGFVSPRSRESECCETR